MSKLNCIALAFSFSIFNLGCGQESVSMAVTKVSSENTANQIIPIESSSLHKEPKVTASASPSPSPSPSPSKIEVEVDTKSGMTCQIQLEYSKSQLPRSYTDQLSAYILYWGFTSVGKIPVPNRVSWIDQWGPDFEDDRYDSIFMQSFDLNKYKGYIKEILFSADLKALPAQAYNDGFSILTLKGEQTTSSPLLQPQNTSQNPPLADENYYTPLNGASKISLQISKIGNMLKFVNQEGWLHFCLQDDTSVLKMKLNLTLSESICIKR